jgi:23S rRNA (guanosine2251-2'-O)-methyltransferase
MSEKIVGRNSVLELLRSSKPEIERILIVQGKVHPRLRQIISIAEKKRIRYDFVPHRELDQIEATVPHQGVIAFVSSTDYIDVQTLVEDAQGHGRPPLLIMLDGIQDPRNLGAIIRTADAVNADGIVIPQNRATGVTTATHKASAGGSAYVPIAQVTNLARTIEMFKTGGIWVVGADGAAPTIYTDANLTVPICLVLGNEAKGLRRLVKEKCDFLVSLPMLGHISTLNVSVATGVLLYEVVRQRTAVENQ